MSDVFVIDRTGLDTLFSVLQRRGYELVAPRLRDQAIVYDTIESTADLPEGWTDEHEAGHYRVKRRDDKALFGYVVGPQSWKKYLFPPVQTVFRAHREDHGYGLQEQPPEDAQRAFIGVRSCELHAIQIQDTVFMGGALADSAYGRRRRASFIVAVNCAEARGTCFCVSMNTGPRAESGFDLALTEILEGDNHYFTLEAGSDDGRDVLAELGPAVAEAAHKAAAEKATANAVSQMGRAMDTDGIKDLLYGNLEHSRWADVADRCLSCANCTLVCPTCFCSTVEDVTDLDGGGAERVRRWDSCFNQDFSYIAGGSVRNSTESRYRQWMTHKLASWYDQFGSSGCVGCGRCISWCPVGIDITEEVAAIRADDRRKQP